MIPPAPRSDSELLRAWSVEHCGESFRHLVEKYLGLVRGVALRRTGSPQLAEEIAQNVFILAARKAGRLEASPSLAPWLHHCAWCETTSALRRELTRRRRMHEYENQAGPQVSSSAEEESMHPALPWLDEALRALNGQERRIVLMRFYEGHALKEIATALGRTEAAVRKQCQRALGKLERCFRRRGVCVPAAVLAAGLSAALPPPPASAASISTLTASAATAAQISATATAAAGAAPAAAGSWIFSIFMNAKITTAVVTAVILSVPLGWQWRRTSLKEEQIARLEAEAARLRQSAGASAGTGQDRKLSGARRPGSPSPGISAAGPSSAGPLRTGQSEAEEAEWRRKLGNPEERPAALTDRAQAILGEKNPARRLKLFSALMDELQPGDYEAVNAGFARQDQQGRLFGPEYELFLATAGSVDGQATMDSIFRWYHASGGTPTGAQQTAMSSWALEEPVKAIEWWNAQEEGAVKNELAKSLISGLALKDINLAWRCLNEFPAEERAPFMGSLVRQQITDLGADGAAGWLASLSASDQSDTAPLKQRGFDSLYHSLVNVPAEKKSEFVDRFANESWMAQTSYPGEIASQWAAKNGTQAVSWASSLPAPLRDAAIVPALTAWSGRQPQEFADWKAAHLADPAYQTALAVFGELSQSPGGNGTSASKPISTPPASEPQASSPSTGGSGAH